MSKKSSNSKPVAPNKKSIPWDIIRAEFIADETLTFSVIAKKHGISKSSVGKKAKSEDWKSLRKVSTDKGVEAVINQKATQIADANKRHLEEAQLIQAATIEGIRRIKDNEVEETIWFRSGEEDAPADLEDGERREKGRRYINGPVYYSKTLSELIRSYRIAADLERNVLGLANNVTKFGDEDGLEQPIVYDIMGGATSGKPDKPDDSNSSPTTS